MKRLKHKLGSFALAVRLLIEDQYLNNRVLLTLQLQFSAFSNESTERPPFLQQDQRQKRTKNKNIVRLILFG